MAFKAIAARRKAELAVVGLLLFSGGTEAAFGPGLNHYHSN
jgi:hypothetical protein